MNYRPSFQQKSHESDYSDYTLHFQPVSNKNGSVLFVDHSKNKKLIIGINVDDIEFKYRVKVEFPAIVADLIDLAVAIYTSDRLAPQSLTEKQRRFHVILPLRHPELLSAEPFRTKLDDLLKWTTDTEWVFDFQKRIAPERLVEHQSLPIAPQGCEVTLWSGGLDALAGLYTRLLMYPEKQFVLFGTGSNKSPTYPHQERVYKEIQSIFPGSCNLFRVPIKVNKSSEQHKNKLSRARGVVFTLIGSACAYLMGQQVLYLYENGMGAINLPYRESAVGLDHSRSVHPLTLLMVSDLVSELLGEEFQVKNPFLFWTKAEMCKALAKNGRDDLPPFTMSCDSPHRQKPVQCGYCSSCILRRQSLAASSIKDRTRYVVLHGKRPVKEPSLYFLNMQAQIQTLDSLFGLSDEPWKNLTKKFPELDDIVDRTAVAENLLPADMRIRLIQLYQNYVSEWNAVESQIAEGLLNKSSYQKASSRYVVSSQQG
ncbi:MULTISPECIES: 7-cyano-7-deazaguanine synthase [unclassified Nodularia (in: cyanobacteria)]|uniref:7-cyano-7-deazaguanine synthase n=1 Tax=unclassified Nodularia (in: cyanobacteria) TaxID=2656917 RepID=UPI0018804D71|nr:MULTISPECIES: 7-cyano-7-deazaguanine synthase [unclassified Nodularia (in: cyanobacteria)]MBE9197676.1 7-cyano-7-deazaguanine synthase [Nodularia sp. LEGE 06071]MCC2694030.1 7-cyano-7-deazaguanine synthase [Nodularia sp. LEGE 04288]